MKASRGLVVMLVSLLTVSAEVAVPIVVAQADSVVQDPTLSTEFQQIAPKPFVPNVEKPKPVEAKKPEVSGGNRVLAKSLKALVFVPSVDQVKAEGISELASVSAGEEGIAILGLDVPEEAAFREKIRPYIGQEITRRRINEIIRDVIFFYREQDRPIVDVYLPEQAMLNSTIQLVLAEAKLGKVAVEGNQYFSDETFLKWIHAAPGEPIYKSQMDEAVVWMNRNPFRRAELIYEPGEEAGKTDAVIKVEDRFPVRVYGGFNDSGNRLTGYETFVGGVNWGQALLGDQELNYQHTRRKKGSFLQAHSLTFIKPLPWKHNLTLLTSYSESDLDAARIGLGGLLTSLNSRSWSFGMRYQVPKIEMTEINDNFTLGFDFKRSENGNAILGIFSPDTVTDVSQMLASYQLSFPVEKALVNAGATLTYSPGGIGGHNHGGLRGLPGDATYSYVKFNAGLTRPMFWGTTLSLRAQAQLASDQLPGSEQMSLGGFGSARGYDSSEATGEEGVQLTAEWYAPAISLGEKFDSKAIKDDKLQFLVFADYGDLSLKNPAATEDVHKTLLSAGPGLRYSIGTHLTLRFDYGFQFKDSDAGRSQRNTRNDRAHFSIEASY